MIGIILDSVLMLLLVAALGYGVRLEKKLTALRAGQLAFAGAVSELNTAAGRAENALQSLRMSGEEADMLHDRIIKARTLKQELEILCNRASSLPLQGEGRPQRIDIPSVDLSSSIPAKVAPASPSMKARESDVDQDRALRMAALAERIQAIEPAPRVSAAPGRDNVSAILGALTANQAAQQSLNRARRSLDEDLFAA